MKPGKIANLRNALGRDARTITISAAVASLVTATPAVAAIVANADKVDGKHAVGSGATVEDRAGKLVATDKKGRLPNNIIAKAVNANRLDGLDSGELRVQIDGETADTNPILNSCGESEVFTYPLTVTEDVHVLATGWSGLHVSADTLTPSIHVRLVDDAEEVVAQSNRDSWSGKGGDTLHISELLFDEETDEPYVAAPGSYSLKVFGRNNGLCEPSTYVQYQDVRLTHLLLPAVQ